MKILYAVQATGNGHISRAREIARAFTKLKQQGRNIKIDWLFSGRPRQQLFDMDCFADYRCLDGLSFVISNGRLDYLQTINQLKLKQFWRDVKNIDLSEYDLLVNDFEPVTAWAAHRQKAPSIGLSNQMAFNYDIPKAKNGFLAKIVLKHYAPTEQPVGLYWSPFDAPLLPPIVTPSQQPIPPTDNKLILVYYPFWPLHKLLALLTPFRDYRFEVFHPVNKVQKMGHIRVNPLSRDVFAKVQQRASGVITAAGFELPSEAMQRGQKLLIIPIKGQFEQESNALALQHMGRATVTYNPQKEILESWLHQPSHQPTRYPDVAFEVAKWLVNDRREPLPNLSKRLWQRSLDEEHDIEPKAATVNSPVTD